MKQGTIFDPIMCYASKSKVNTILEAAKYQDGKVEIDMSVSMNDIAAVGTADNIGKGTQNCRRMEIRNQEKRNQKK